MIDCVEVRYALVRRCSLTSGDEAQMENGRGIKKGEGRE